MNEDIITFKILILGEVAVGKTSFLYRYVEEYFPEEYIATIGVDFKTKKIKKNDTQIELQIWDTCGQERFRSLTKSFLNGADGIIFMYDISNKDSFINIKRWINETENLSDEFKKIIVGNKKDLPTRAVSIDTVNKLYNNKNITGMEASAKTGENVKEVFDSLINLIVGNMTKDEIINKYGNKDKQKKVLNFEKVKPKEGKEGKRCC